MREIEQLFQTSKINEIKELLKIIIQKIEEAEPKEQERMLKNIVNNAKTTEKKLRETYTIMEGVTIFPEDIAPLALLTEEISNDADNNEDMLQVLKFNLNNYFKRFKESKNNDWHVETETLQNVLGALILECDYFKAIHKQGIHISIMMFHNRFRRSSMEVLNYSSIKHENFAIHSFYCEDSKINKKTVSEICLEQFGYLLNEVIVNNSQKVPDGFLELFEEIDMPEIDDESKEATALFANTFAHYIIEKMEIRVAKELGNDVIEHLETRNEKFVHKMLEYFDDIFRELLKENEEWEDNVECPCGSGKKYKNCCKKKKIKYYKGEDEEHYIKSIPIHPKLDKMLENEKLRFRKVFGRMPGNTDYIHGGILLRDVNQGYKLMKRSNIVDKAWLYASHKTGYMLTEFNKELIPEREVKEFAKYVYEYKKIMKGKIKGEKWNILQAVEATNFILETMVQEEIPNMIYALNLNVNFYSSDSQKDSKFIIHNIKDFLIFCAYKASVQLTVLGKLIEEGYYDTAMAENRIIYEILISMKAYKKNPDLFKKKILSVAGLEIGTHRKIDNSGIIEDIKTGEQYKYKIQKKQLSENAGENYVRLYEILYSELSEFIHLDTESAKGIFKEKDLFEDIDECLIAGCIGMILSLEILMELIDFEGNDSKMSKDLKYFTNRLLKDFLCILPTIISIEEKEVYKVLEDTLKEYKTDYKINYQRNCKTEIY